MTIIILAKHIVIMFGLLFCVSLLMLNFKIRNKFGLYLKRLSLIMTKGNVIAHDLFIRKNEYLFSVANISFLDCAHKQYIFRNMLTIKLTCDFELLDRYIKSYIKRTPCDASILAIELSSLVNSMVKTFDDRFYYWLKSKYGDSKAYRILLLIMEGKVDNGPLKNIGYEKMRYKRVTSLLRRITEEMVNSDVFYTNDRRLEFFLTELQTTIRNVILNIEQDFRRLNGEFLHILEDED